MKAQRIWGPAEPYYGAELLQSTLKLAPNLHLPGPESSHSNRKFAARILPASCTRSFGILQILFGSGFASRCRFDVDNFCLRVTL